MLGLVSCADAHFFKIRMLAALYCKMYVAHCCILVLITRTHTRERTHTPLSHFNNTQSISFLHSHKDP